MRFAWVSAVTAALLLSACGQGQDPAKALETSHPEAARAALQRVEKGK